MSSDPKEVLKGRFHQATGVPFVEVLKGNASKYLGEKEELRKQVQASTEAFDKQTKITDDLDKRIQDTAAILTLYNEAANTSNADALNANKVYIDAKAKQNAKGWSFFITPKEDIPKQAAKDLSTKIPYIGPVLNLGYKAADVKEYYDLRQQTNAAEASNREASVKAAEARQTYDKEKKNYDELMDHHKKEITILANCRDAKDQYQKRFGDK